MIDLESLNMLKDIMEEEFQPLIELYIRDSDRRFPEMRKALSEGDCESLRMTVHSLKGASSNVCAVDFAEQAYTVEKMAIDGALDQLPGAIDALEQSYQQVRQQLSALV